MTFENLNSLLIEWGQSRNIVHADTDQVLAQIGKIYEELKEFEFAFREYAISTRYDDSGPSEEFRNRVRQELVLELGDVLVTVVITAACMKLDPVDALRQAYDKIKNRTGKTVNGVFVKDATVH